MFIKELPFVVHLLSDFPNNFDCFSVISPRHVCCYRTASIYVLKWNFFGFSMKYSAATGPPVGPECEHCGQRHQVAHIHQRTDIQMQLLVSLYVY